MRLLLPLAVLLSACAVVPDAAGDSDPAMQLVFSDEFDLGPAVDPANWAFDRHRNARGWYNDELQYYGPSGAEVRDGTLRITARKVGPGDVVESESDYNGQDYVSARLHTKGLFAFTYGRAEARIKVPCGRGLWPAFWMLPENDGRWPEGGEIDIMEYVGHQPKTFHATVHTGDLNHAAGTEVGRKKRVAQACDAWHTHRLDWGPERLSVALDSETYFAFARKQGGEGRWPFDEDFHLLLNLAVGGSWGGREGVDEAAFPATMEVDYVRVWQARN